VDTPDFAQIAASFDRQREGGGERAAWYVPGRIEVLGKHTDYAGGRSLLCATERGFRAMSAARSDRQLVLTDLRRTSSLVLTPDQPSSPISWGTYPLAVLRRLASNFPEARHGADIVFESSLPSASGLSTSSALVVMALLALAHANDLERTERWIANIRSVEDLAAYAATIENGSSFRALTGTRGVGTEGGSEDHTAILCSRANQLAQYAFCPTRHERSIELMPGLVFAIGVSGVAASKTGTARDDYNRAARSAQHILERWRAHFGRDDASLADAVASAPDAADRLREVLRADGEPLIERFNQFVEESTVLVPTAADALARGDLASFGAAVARSQELAERGLGNQVPETIALVREARLCGAVAASAFGAGFGGSVWALIEQSTASAFLDRWQNAYAAAYPVAAARATFFLTRPAQGAVRVEQPES
jgi:galactokinase